MIIELDDEELQFMSKNEIEGLLAEGPITIQIPLPSVNSSNSYIDIIWDYLDASFAIETLSNNFPTKNLSKLWDIKHHPVYHLTIESPNKALLSSTIKQLIWSSQYPLEESSQLEFENYREKINEYEWKITEINLNYPEIIDDYLINLINGAYHELEYEIIEGHLSHFPERHYGFFSGAKYNTSKTKILFSSNSWIVPKSFNLEEVFCDHSYNEQISLLPAHILMIDHKTVAISETGVIEIPMGQVLQAVACYEEHTSPADKYRHKLSLDGTFFQHSPEATDYSLAHPEKPTPYKVFTSEFSDFCVISTTNANIVLFDISQIKNNDSQKFIEAAKQLLSSIEDELITDPETNVNWNNFDDEKFEQLCYDVIYHNSKFDRKTIRKMGRSRSRDGGRDIVVFTKSISGEKPRKYIFQCKLSRREKSINTSNVGSISDVIDQYNADGYGLMCNCYIDATLFDRLDGISTNRGIEIETWSAFEIERFLSRRPLIKQRYHIH